MGLQEHLLRQRNGLIVRTEAACRVCAVVNAETPLPAGDKDIASDIQEDKGVQNEAEERRNEHLYEFFSWGLAKSLCLSLTNM